MPFAPFLRYKSTGKNSTKRSLLNQGSPLALNGCSPSQYSTSSIGQQRTCQQFIQNGARATCGIAKSSMGKKIRPISNGVSKANRKPKSISKVKQDDLKWMIPGSVQILTLVVAAIAVSVILVINTDTFSYLIGNNKNSTTWQTFVDPPDSQTTFKKVNNDKASSNQKIFTKGGWRKASQKVLDKYGSSKCTIDRKSVEELTEDIFEKHYRYKRPLIVTFPNGAKGWTNPSKWTVKSLKQEYGEWSILSGNAREIVRLGGNGDLESSFSEFVDRIMKEQDTLGEPFYVFDRRFYNDSSLPQTLKPPKYFKIQDGLDDSIFFLGASSSGVSFHKHADAWNGVIYGRKRWFIYPVHLTPPGGVYPGFTQMEWIEQVYPYLDEDHKPLECVQEAGEIFYLPESTYHATINLGDTVAVGIQKRQAVTPAEKLFYEELAITMASKDASPKKLQKIKQRKIEIFKELHKYLPDNAEVYMKMGSVYSDMDKDDLAVEYTQKAIDLDPYFVIAYINKAKLLSKMNRPSEAEEAYLAALKLNPSLWDVVAQYGTFLLDNNRPAEAVQYFARGTEVQPSMKPFWYYLQQAQLQSGDMEGARKTGEHLERLNDKK